MNLTSDDLAGLGRCFIPPELAERAGWRRLASFEAGQRVGRNGSGDWSGIEIPYLWPGQSNPISYRLRLDHPEQEFKNGELRDKRKYLQAPGERNHLYLPPGITVDDLQNVALPVVISEGEKKALALDALSRHGMPEGGRRLLPIGLAGVWGWRGKVGKELAPDGSYQPVKGVIPDFDRIAWNGRRVSLLFDANTASNSGVAAARAELSRELASRGADVHLIDLPAEAGINGIDDFLGRHGAEAGLELLKTARPFEPTFPNTELGLARRIIHEHGRDLKHTRAMGWRVFNGRFWAADETGEIFRRAKDTIPGIFRDAATEKDEKRRSEMAAFGIRAQAHNCLANALRHAESEIEVAAVEGAFDQHPMLLNVENGTIDLETGELLPHNRAHLFTRCCPVAYDPIARLELWERFLRDATGGDEAYCAFLQKVAGYFLSASTAEEKLFFAYGPTATGKSTIAEAIKATMGPYAATANFETFLEQSHNAGAARPDLARLAGVRLVTSSEVKKGEALAEEIVKTLTGGETVSARFLYKTDFEFRPTFKLLLLANDAPRVRDDSDAMWRRILRLPFDRIVPPEKRDPKVKETLRNPQIAGPAILAWMIKGVLAWQREGLTIPRAVADCTAAYKREMDPLADFLSDYEMGANVIGKIAVGELRQEYEQWGKDNGVRRLLGRKEFNKRLEAAGGQPGRNESGRYWDGIARKK